MRPVCEISSDRHSPDGRRILGEIELPLDPDSEPRIRAWLVEVLSLLDLQAGFVHRILDSARDAVMRLEASDEAAAPGGCIHVILSGPRRAGAECETWGFFRIEKLENTAPGDARPEHSIEFYLYAEED